MIGIAQPRAGRPSVTVLMPVRDGMPYLERAVRSVLQQTLTDFELLIVDDVSTDGSADFVRTLRDPRVRLLQNERNLGVTRTLNRGIAHARAPLIARLDADDLAERTRLARQVMFLEAHADVALVGSAVSYIDEQDRPFMAFAFPTDPDEIYRELLRWCCFSHSCVTFRASAVNAVGGYSESVAHAQDYDLWLRLADRFPLANLPEMLGSYRVHAAQVSHTRRRLQRDLANKCRHEAARRRHATGRLTDPAGFAPPTLLARLLGRENTLGADGVRWAGIYGRMHRPGRSLGHAARACLDSPLNPAAYAAALNALFDLLVPRVLRRRAAWYTARLRNPRQGAGA